MILLFQRCSILKQRAIEEKFLVQKHGTPLGHFAPARYVAIMVLELKFSKFEQLSTYLDIQVVHCPRHFRGAVF